MQDNLLDEFLEKVNFFALLVLLEINNGNQWRGQGHCLKLRLGLPHVNVVLCLP